MILLATNIFDPGMMRFFVSIYEQKRSSIFLKLALKFTSVST
jgi:hypothetical protein